MSKLIKIIPISALALATLVANPVFAKVPFHAGDNRTPAASVATNTSVRTASLGRYGRQTKVTNTETLQACAHTHRFSWQHWM